VSSSNQHADQQSGHLIGVALPLAQQGFRRNQAIWLKD